MAFPNRGGFDFWLGGRPFALVNKFMGSFDYWFVRPLIMLDIIVTILFWKFMSYQTKVAPFDTAGPEKLVHNVWVTPHNVGPM